MQRGRPWDRILSTEFVLSRKQKTRAGITSTVIISLLFFVSFAIGAGLGPDPLKPPELVAGGFFSLAVGFCVAVLFSRRRLEAEAELVANLREGKKRRRVVVYDAYLTVDGKVVARSALNSVKLEDTELALGWTDEQGEDHDRSFTGRRDDLYRVSTLLMSNSA